MSVALNIPQLETERLILRAPRAADFEPESVFYASEEARFLGGPQEASATWRTLAVMIGHWVLRGYGFWAVEDKASGAYLGRVGLWNPMGWREEEISWALMPYAQGRGFATEAAFAVRRHAYEVLGWQTAISQISVENEPSKALARRMGAQLETTYDVPDFGMMEVWRHLSPAAARKQDAEAAA